MTLKEKILSRKALLWIGITLAALVVLGAVAAIILLNLPPKEPAEPAHMQTPVYTPPEKTTLKPQDFVYEGDYLTCTATPAILGVDVSQHQGEIDWQAVKDAGMEFVIIRVGGRGYGVGGILYTDDMAQSYYEGAKAAGLQVGAYFFSQAVSAAEAAEEAELTLQQIQGWELDFPVVYDWERQEGTARTAKTDPRTVTDCMKAFCRVIEEAGYRPMVYFNPDHSDSLFYIEEVTEYDFWLAFYTEWNTYPYKVDMWQYTHTGTVPGITGNADINLYFPEME